MSLKQRRGFKAFTRVAAVMLVGAGLSACSTVPDWADPTNWLGPDVPDQGQADNGQYPDLAKIPNAPKAQSTPDERQKVADALVAARNDVQYSAEALRGGGVAAAPPPGPPAPPPTQVASVQPAPAATQPESQPETPEPAAAPEAASSEAAPAPASESEAQSEPAVPAVPATGSSETASNAVAPESGGEPAVPAVPDVGPVPSAPTTASSTSASAPVSTPSAPPPVQASNTAGFAPSRAPALSASVAEFVPAPIIAHYAQSAPIGGPPATSSQVALNAPPGTRSEPVGTGEKNVGGPGSMSGAVVANLGTLDGAQAPQSVYAGAGGPVAVVLFHRHSSALDARALRQVRAAVAAYRARGGQGYIRVVGHSASRTGNMSLVRHMELNFERSQARAKAVARALIRAGVPADKVLVDAVGDARPVYRESMPKGENGNRRAEIFLQG